MEIRQMRAGDLFIVADMERRLFSDPWSVEAFRGGLMSRNQLYLVIDDEGTIAGYCGIMLVADEAEILNIAVDIPYRRQHLATELLNFVFEIGDENGINLYSLEVRENNAPAIALYNSCGFVPVGRRKEYYSNPKEDAILMALEV